MTNLKIETKNTEISNHYESIQKRIDLREEMNNDIKSILTPEQQTLFASIQKERKNKRKFKRTQARKNKKALRAEIKAYRIKNIKPIMLQQRKKLEANVSKEDKIRLAELRPVFELLKKNRKEFKQSDERPKYKQRIDKKKKIRQKYATEFDALAELKKKYAPEIKSLMDEVKPQSQKWDKDLKAIRNKHLQVQSKNMGKKNRQKHKKQRHNKHHKNRASRMGGRHFLLLDVS